MFGFWSFADPPRVRIGMTGSRGRDGYRTIGDSLPPDLSPRSLESYISSSRRVRSLRSVCGERASNAALSKECRTLLSLTNQPPRRRRGTSKSPAAKVSMRVADELWPAEVDLILSALDAGHSAPVAANTITGNLTQDDSVDRRLRSRTPYRVRAELKLFSDPAEAAPWLLFTRDIDAKGVGFITSHRLPLGYGGWIELFTPRGEKVRVNCTLFRCREAAPGWYEGALYFNREQWQFEVE
jgi:hypothetical protein